MQGSKKERYARKRKFLKEEKDFDKKYYRVIIALIVFYLIYHAFRPTIIGLDSRYTWCVFWLPTLAGMLAMGIWRRKVLLFHIMAEKRMGLRLLMVVFYSVQGLIFSYLSFGQLASLSWDIVHYLAVKNQSEKIIYCDNVEFNGRRHTSLGFTLHGQYESFRVPNETFRYYVKEKLDRYRVGMKVKEGIWDCYQIDDYWLEEKESLKK